jgi:NAD(P)-dependent dehydrogenase (short-subunit alcohol dehydrogenase family)
MPLNENDVVVISGGARGVTGDAALALARTFRSTLVLLGRSPLAESEPAWLRGLYSEAEIKKAVFKNLPSGSSPSSVEVNYRQLLAQREIRAQLERLDAAGARAVYCSVDVRDGATVARVLTEIRQRHGAIRGLVHGAGVLADRRIEDKTEEQFDSVYGTKVTGLQNLLSALAHEELKVIALFSSYTGRFGRIGQVDYAAANEVLNKLAQQESRRRPDCRVVSVNWGPWNGGMVTPGLRKIFEQEGVGLIEPAAGAEFLVREICFRGKGEVEVLALAPGPQLVRAPAPRPVGGPQASVAFEREVSVKALPCLESHVFNGRAVLPAALMVEWLAQAALHGNPGMKFHGLDDFKVLKGVVLNAGQSVTVSLLVGSGRPHDNLHVLPVRMISRAGSREVLHAQADVLLTEERLPAAPAAEVVNITGGAIADAYALGVLFHGAALHGIERVEVCAERGVAALVKAASAPIKWMSNPLRGTWIADPLALDSAFQMMILWSAAHRGGPSLPSALAHYRQFVAAFPKGGCRAVIGVALGISAIAVATIQFLDHQGNLLASAEGCEFVVDAGLRDAFRLNRLKLET